MDAVPGIALTEDKVIAWVVCPTCHADPSVPCRSAGGRPVPVHRSRYLAAKDYAYEHAKLERWQRDARRG